MNLLSYKNRFKPSAFAPINIDEINGYREALEDILSFLKEKTEFNPAKRMVDSVDILDSISETSGKITELYQRAEMELQGAFNELAGVDLGSDKVNQFLKDQITDPNDIKDINI